MTMVLGLIRELHSVIEKERKKERERETDRQKTGIFVMSSNNLLGSEFSFVMSSFHTFMLFVQVQCMV